MSTLQELQFPVDQAIFAAVLGCLPDGWKKARLLAAQKVSNAGTSMSIRIDALGQPGIALISDELQDRTRELFILNDRFQTDLRAIDYLYEQRPDGRWAFEASFEYV